MGHLESTIAELVGRLESSCLLNSNADEYLNFESVAKLLGKSEKTIRRWADREHEPLPSIKIFRNKQFTWSFRKSEVLDWVNQYQRS